LFEQGVKQPPRYVVPGGFPLLAIIKNSTRADTDRHYLAGFKEVKPTSTP